MIHRRTTAAVSALAGITVALAVGVVLPGAASAAAAGAGAVTGSATFSPLTGDQDTNLVLTTGGLGPTGATALTVLVTGGDAGASQVTGGNGNGIIVGVSNLSSFGRSHGGYVIPLTQSMADFAQTQEPVLAPIQGAYSYTARCRTSGDSTSLGDFAAELTWTPGAGSASTYAATQATTTALQAAPTSPQLEGTKITLTATVTPATATGTVQFTDGADKLGAPVPVSNGSATVETVLPVGSRSLSASFVGSSRVLTGSTSPAVSYTINPAPASFRPVLYGAVQVSGQPSCLADFDRATTVNYQWLLDGTPISGATAISYTVPESAYNRVLSCQVTAANGDTAPITASSRKATVAVGPALRATGAPTMTGPVRKGQRLTAKVGSFTPAATTTSFQWLRDGKAIASATAASYVVGAADTGRLVSVTVTVQRAGWTSTSVTTKAVKAAK